MSDFQEVSFWSRNPELEGAVSHGSETEDSGLVARLATKPIPVPLDAVPGLDPASDLAKRLAHPMFRLWMVPHSFGVIRRMGLREPTGASLEVRYLAKGTCSVQGLMPAPEFVEIGGVSFGCRLGADGRLAPSYEPLGAAHAVAGLSAAASAEASGSLSFQASLAIPRVSAVGTGGDHAEWHFGELGRSVLGRDVNCWTILVLSRRQKELAMKARLRVTHRLAFFSACMDSDWVEMVAPLAG